jgi:carbonic anhydrase
MHATPAPIPVPAADAFERLVRGNERFCRGEARWSATRPESLAALPQEHRPFATILGCSDSRVSPELVFDTGLGELFVVRVAGNVMSCEASGSMQYAGSYLHTQLFVVLGHDGCGAVQAALETMLRGTRHRSRIHTLIENILPALGSIDRRLTSSAQLSLAVERNVQWSMRQIAESPEGRARLAAGEMKLVGGVYQVASGRVRFLEES